MIVLICKQTSYKLESTFPVIIVEKLASFSFPSLSMLISKTFMPKRTRETNGFILFLPAFSGHLPARREYAQTGLRTHARCHRYSIPQPVKVGHTTGSQTLTLFEGSGEKQYVPHSWNVYVVFSGSVSTNYDLDCSYWVVLASKH